MIPLTERHDPVAAPVIRVEVSPDPMGVAWELLDACTDHDGVTDVLEQHGDALPHGALVRVVEHGETIALHVADSARGALVPVPDWPRLVALWESDDAPAMLRGCSRVNLRRLVLTACDFAESVLHLVPAREERPRRAIETAREWVRGRATQDEVWAAARSAAYATNAASAAAAARCAAYAADAAGAAADAAEAAYAADYAADYAATTAEAVVYATAATAATATSIVLRHIPLAVVACASVGARDPLPFVAG